ncbi:MAG TPA: SCP2 sterol-binding domain-containing protein [Steroidobacteraceae bacterium]
MIATRPLLATIENVLNRGLSRSPRARQLCAELAGQRLAIEIAELGSILLSSTGECLQVTQAADATAAARLSGGPFSLLALAGSNPEAVLRRGDVRIEGDAQLAGKFRELGALLRPDPEEELSQLLGDVPAHHLGRLARTALGWSCKAASTAVRNLAEYLGHETRDLVPAAEADDFLRAVDVLREDVERLEARIALLSVPSRARAGDPRGT